MSRNGPGEHVGEAAMAVGGMDCASCVSHVEKAAMGVAGVLSCNVNLARGRAVVRFDEKRTNLEAVAAAITRSGYTAAPETEAIKEDHVGHHAATADAWVRRAVVGVILWLPVELTHWIMVITSAGHHRHGTDWMDWLALATSAAAMVYVGRGFYAGAARGLRHGRANMDTLIAMGASVAWGYSLVAFAGWQLGWWTARPELYFMEASGLLALISVGHALEARARDSAGSAIRKLLDLTPARALRIKGDDTSSIEEVPVSQLSPGQKLLVRPGDRVPADGVVVEGKSDVDESMVSGEPLPVLRGPGDAVIGGTLNQNGRLVVRATQVGAESVLGQIVAMVDKAQSSKAPVQRLADQIAAVFVPVVLAVAILTAAAWGLWGWSHGWEAAATWGRLANATCSVLIIACPCALGLAVPAALMVGTGRGAARGILIRDISVLEKAQGIDVVVLDKTGTITQGKPVASEVAPLDGVDEGVVLRLAADAEQFSEHPLARAIVARARAENLAIGPVTSFSNDAGLGVTADVEGQTVLVGNAALMEKRGIAPAARPAAWGGTVVHVAAARDGKFRQVGLIHLSDRIKPDSAAAVAALRAMGLKTLLLTGDNLEAARAIAAEAGIDDVRAGVLPGQKAEVIAALQAQGRRVAMVGDGVNDAPALAQADLGIAIGSGSDIAKETGGIVLVSGSLLGIVTAIRLSRATMKKIRQNLALAFIYNVLAIPLAALGLLNPLIAAAAMALSDVTVIGNALMLRRQKID